MSNQVRLRLLPSIRCLFDEPVQVKVSGLRSRQEVTMRARSTDERGVVFSSSATYRADGNGEIDLNRDPSLSGSYDGVEPMGLLWSLRADALHKYFYKNKALEPFMVNFSVHEKEGRMLAEATNERFLMGDGVTRVPVQKGNIRGVLFTPPGEGPFPAVLDLNTFMSEKRACLLANKGFIVLAVPVFTEKPDSLKKMHLDHFEEAVNFLQQLPKRRRPGLPTWADVTSRAVERTGLAVIRGKNSNLLFTYGQAGGKGVGIISRSKGADIALSLAAFVPGVEAVVWINGCSANIGIPLYYKQRQILSSLICDINKVIPTESGANIIKYAVGNPLLEENRGSFVPIERANSRFLFVASEEDLNWDSKAYLDGMVERLKHHGKENFESVVYPGVGHLLEPPYGPFCPSAFHGMLSFNVLWGGEPRAHTAAEVHLWKKIQEFLRTHLSCDAAKSNL